MSNGDRSMSDSALIYVGPDAAGATMFYELIDLSRPNSSNDRWEQPVPPGMTRTEAAYHSLIKGLRAATERDRSNVMVTTIDTPLIDHIRHGARPSDELRPLYEKATHLIDQFDGVCLTVPDVRESRLK